MPWLQDTHPELADDYARIYRRAYAPPEVAKRIAGLVRGADGRAA